MCAQQAGVTGALAITLVGADGSVAHDVVFWCCACPFLCGPHEMDCMRGLRWRGSAHKQPSHMASACLDSQERELMLLFA